MCCIEITLQTSTCGALSGVVTDPGHAVVHDVKIEIRANAKVWKLVV